MHGEALHQARMVAPGLGKADAGDRPERLAGPKGPARCRQVLHGSRAKWGRAE